MTQNEPGGIVALTAQTQQILAQALRQIEFAALHMVAGMSKGDLEELRGRTQLLPQLPCAGIGMAGFRRGEAFDGAQHHAQGTANFEFLSLAFEILRQQRQLVQPLLELRGRLYQGRAGGGTMTGLAPVGDRFFHEPGLGVMLREDLGLTVHVLR